MKLFILKYTLPALNLLAAALTLMPVWFDLNALNNASWVVYIFPVLCLANVSVLLMEAPLLVMRWVLGFDRVWFFLGVIVLTVHMFMFKELGQWSWGQMAFEFVSASWPVVLLLANALVLGRRVSAHAVTHG